MFTKLPKISLPQNTGDLAKAVIAGDKKACAEFYKKVIPVILGYIMGKYSAFINDKDGEDILSEVLIRLMNYPFKTEHSGKIAAKIFSCWITKTVNSVYVDRVRYQKAQKRDRDKEVSGSEGISGSVEEITGDNSEAYDDIEQGDFSKSIIYRRAIEMALNSHSEPEGRAIKFHFLEGRTVAEAAKKHGLTPGRLNSRISVFRRELAEILESYDKNTRKFRFIR